jgi:hypothetical protein
MGTHRTEAQFHRYYTGVPFWRHSHHHSCHRNSVRRRLLRVPYLQATERPETKAT